MTATRVTIAFGDGIGPEIMRASLAVLEAAAAPLVYETVEIGEAVFRKGVPSGIPQEAWAVLRRNRCFLKAPVTTPQGKGFKSVNVAIRNALELFANVRPCKSYSPFVASFHPRMDLVIIRENEEDLYTGIEYRPTPEATQAVKLVTRPGCEAIVRYAFEYARVYGRRRVTCMTKDNIMKLTDGLFHRVFEEIGAGYADIEREHQIIDIGAAHLAAQPEALDVVVTLNLYGDILSDIAAQVAGSVGLAGSANIGEHAAMFEAVHGSAPDIAGRDVANPSGLLSAAVQMLVHLGHGKTAERIANAWLCTLEDGVHTADIFREGVSRERVGTRAFADAVAARLGKTPQRLTPVNYRSMPVSIARGAGRAEPRRLSGVDVFVYWDAPGRDPRALGQRLDALCAGPLRLALIANRGVAVYPQGVPETFCTDHWRCRFLPGSGHITPRDIIDLLGLLGEGGLEVVATQNIYSYGGAPGDGPDSSG
jgi:isocitrate dehydrogenase